MVLIFSYGYNMCPRLDPSDIIVITPAFVPNYQLRFQKFLKIDNNPSRYGYANAEVSEFDCLFGVLQDITPRGVAKLDFQENCINSPEQNNTYDRKTVEVIGDNGITYRAIMYVMNPRRALQYAKPSKRYKDHMLQSALLYKKIGYALEHILSIMQA